MRTIDDLKDRISITIDKELLDWIDDKIIKRIFANRSHALEFLAKKRMNSEGIWDFSPKEASER